MSFVKVTFARTDETLMLGEMTIVADSIPGGGMAVAQEVDEASLPDAARKRAARLQCETATVILQWTHGSYTEAVCLRLMTLAEARELRGKATICRSDGWHRIEIESWKNEALRLRAELAAR